MKCGRPSTDSKTDHTGASTGSITLVTSAMLHPGDSEALS